MLLHRVKTGTREEQLSWLSQFSIKNKKKRSGRWVKQSRHFRPPVDTDTCCIHPQSRILFPTIILFLGSSSSSLIDHKYYNSFIFISFHTLHNSISPSNFISHTKTLLQHNLVNIKIFIQQQCCLNL